MKVFVTGAPGFIGSAVVADLLANNHTVVGLARSDASAEKVKSMGAEVHRGDIEDVGSLRSGAKAADGVIHLAFVHDFTDFERCCKIDRDAITAMAEMMEGTNKPLVIASGVLHLPHGITSTEETDVDWANPFSVRGKSETLIKELSKSKGIRGSAIRLSPTVHGKGDKAFIPMLSDMAKKAGFVTRVGDGENHWPAVHRLDAATIFRLALEKGKAGGVYHATAEGGVKLKDICDAMSKGLKLPIEQKTVEEAGASIGFFAHPAARDVFCSIEQTQKELGWQPKQPGLIADMEANYY